MKGENTTTGNDYQLTKRQHVIPQASIKRFYNDNEQVLVNLIEPKKSFSAKSDNGAFVVNRVWDQRAERVWMFDIEAQFQDIAQLIYAGLQLKLEQSQHKVISKMYLLIYMRMQFSKNLIEDKKFHGDGKHASPLTKKEIEKLESMGISSVDENGYLNSRFITSGVMQIKIMQHMKSVFKGIEWMVLHSGGEDYIFSDCYNGYRVLPLSPKLCFIARNDLSKEPMLNDSCFVNEVGKRHAIYLFFERINQLKDT